MDRHLSPRARAVLKELRARANPENVAGMARFGINPENALGISVVDLRKMAKGIGKSHALALELWSSEVHEARILAAFVDEPSKVTEGQMDNWVEEFDSWDVCDQVCCNLFDRTPFAYEKAAEWCRREEEFVKRAGYVMMACLAVHDKAAEDRPFIEFMKLIEMGSADERKYVKRAVNWALRQIGKRNKRLNEAAIKTAGSISKIDSKAARWVASDALRELRGETAKRKVGL